ncbi:MAG: hypothetical protein C0179_05075 [Fervidicoccus sp.]|nr:MAG: hypothetical protein C0179_05075 [Fervidicoccus sp.]
MVSSSSTVVDGKKVSLVAYGHYDTKHKKWYIYDIFAIVCGESVESECSIYSFKKEYFLDNIDEIEDYGIPLYILRSRRIHEEAKRHMAGEIAKIHTWEILPA